MKSRLITRLAYGLLTTIAVMCLACGEVERAPQVTTPTLPGESTEELSLGQGLPLGATAPAFSLPDGEGNFHALAEYRGQKVVLVFYRTGT